MALNNIIGQGKAVTMLRGMMERQRVASSYIFCGEPGIGKKTTAISFAKALNCLNRLDTVDACDACASCRKIDAGVHPDFLLLATEDRTIKIEEIRAIEEALSFKPYEGRYKIIIIDEAEAMTLPAANAFLKTLEEPPDASVIILVTARPDMLPATIRSRCCRVNFFPLAEGSSRQVLSGSFEGPALELLLRLSMGRPGEALSGGLLESRDWSMGLFRDMLKSEKDRWASREEMERWFDQSLFLLRDMASLKISGDPSRLINRDLHAELSRLSKSVGLTVILYLYDELSLLKGLLFYNLNKSITWNYTASLLRKELLGNHA
ncbi:MAG: DNA polymerase III subunit delta' [Nitrospirae bacterium]|nr:MAG: DNA polymerase III subunit delta' [Nitrospirota bacterium]